MQWGKLTVRQFDSTIHHPEKDNNNKKYWQISSIELYNQIYTKIHYFQNKANLKRSQDFNSQYFRIKNYELNRLKRDKYKQ